MASQGSLDRKAIAWQHETAIRRTGSIFSRRGRRIRLVGTAGRVEIWRGGGRFSRNCVSDPFGLSVSEYLTVSSVSRSRSSNRMCDFLASGFRTRGTALLHTVKPGFAFAQAVKRHLYLPRIYKVARPMANRYPLLYFQRCP